MINNGNGEEEKKTKNYDKEDDVDEEDIEDLYEKEYDNEDDLSKEEDENFVFSVHLLYTWDPSQLHNQFSH